MVKTISDTIAYCGTDCAECPAYLAKRADDYELKVKTAQEWGDPEHPVEPEEISCDGCKTPDGEKYKFCLTVCNVRRCALSRHVEICTYCSDFPCGELELFSEIVGGDVVPQLEQFIE
jgi:hypothetical protein